MLLRLFISVLFFCLSYPISAKQLALSFDDSPRAANGLMTGPERAEKLLNVLKTHRVEEVAFFAVSKHLDGEGKKRLKSFGDAGHLIANHTHSHPDINATSLQQYIDNIQLAEDALNTYPNYTKWFRFPYLREGNTLEKRDGVRQFLQGKGYINAYITMNNYDWYIENLFQRAVADGVEMDMAAMERFYVDILMESIVYYDELAREYLNRSPKHMLLLHETDIAALFIGALVEKLRSEGWEIIPASEAYDDDIADYQSPKVRKYNPGRIGEIASDSGKKKNLWHRTLDEAYLSEQFERRVLKEKTVDAP